MAQAENLAEAFLVRWLWGCGGQGGAQGSTEWLFPAWKGVQLSPVKAPPPDLYSELVRGLSASLPAGRSG